MNEPPTLMSALDTRKHPRHGWLYREMFGGRWWVVKDPMQPFLHVAAEICKARANNGVKSGLGECVNALKRFTLLRLGMDPEGVVGVEIQMKRPAGCPGCGRKRAGV